MIRRMTEEDLSVVMRMETLCLPCHWKEKDFLYELRENPYATLYVEEEGGLLCGYIGLWIIFERAEITTLAVDPCFRRQGIAYRLLKHALSEAEKQGCEIAFLEVRESNEVARNLYRKFGFEDWRIKKDYYQDNHEDALEMIFTLGGLCEQENIGN